MIEKLKRLLNYPNQQVKGEIEKLIKELENGVERDSNGESRKISPKSSAGNGGLNNRPKKKGQPKVSAVPKAL